MLIPINNYDEKLKISSGVKEENAPRKEEENKNEKNLLYNNWLIKLNDSFDPYLISETKYRSSIIFQIDQFLNKNLSINLRFLVSR